MMRRLMVAAALGVAALAPIVPGGRALGEAAVSRDWTRAVAATPEGGFRMGNPAARVKLVEYGSLTCGHCARFVREGMPALMPEIRSGRVSLEFRNFVLNPPDLAASLIARCAGPRRFFTAIERIYAAQDQWLPRAAAISEAEAEVIAKLPPPQIAVRYGAIIDLRSIAAGVGVSPAREKACLADSAAIDRLLEMRRAGSALGIRGTPAFAVNGRLIDEAHDWTTLRPHLGPPPG